MNVVFDLGAVLFTWQPAQLLQAHFPELAADPAAAEPMARAIFHHEDWLGFDRGTLSLAQSIDRIARRLALPPDALDRMLSPLGERLAPIAPTVDLLGRLHAQRGERRDLRLFYLSNMPAPYARVLESRHALFACFDGGIFSGDVQLAKPDPAIYRLLAERHGLEPARTVFIDDMLHNVEAARGLGWRGIQFASAAQLEAELHREMAGL